MSPLGFLFITTIVILTLIVYLIYDYSGPKRILIRPDKAFGIVCLRAKDLIVQEFDCKGNLWATRGFLIYCLNKSEDKFKRIARVPSGFSIFWLNSFKIIRKLTLKSECIEMTVNEDGQICAFSSGKMWICGGIGKKFHKTLTLPHYGMGVSRGIMSTGLLKVEGREFLFGEYYSNPYRNNVKIVKFINYDITWETVYEFLPGQIRHIHALQQDPYTGILWICTGDEDNEAMIGWSTDNFKTIIPIGQGSQTWRACQLVFTEKAVYWGADTGSIDLAGIYRWDKESKELQKLHSIPGAVFFGTRLANGTIIMSTDREGFPNETDEKTRLIFITKDNKITMINCGIWDYKKLGFRFNFAKLRFQRTQGGQMLAISCLNQKEFPDGELLLFDEGDLIA